MKLFKTTSHNLCPVMYHKNSCTTQCTEQFQWIRIHALMGSNLQMIHFHCSTSYYVQTWRNTSNQLNRKLKQCLLRLRNQKEMETRATKNELDTLPKIRTQFSKYTKRTVMKNKNSNTNNKQTIESRILCLSVHFSDFHQYSL